MDKVLDIAEFATPATWQKAMVRHGFQTLEATPAELLEFCERLEFSEEHPEKGTKSKGVSKSASTTAIAQAKPTARGKHKKNSNNKRNHDTDKWCAFHQTSSHDTSKCKVILDQVKRMRSTLTTENSKKKRTFKNKTLTHQASAPNKNEEEIHVLVEKEVACALEACGTGQKRKNTDELHNVEEQFEELEIAEDLE